MANFNKTHYLKSWHDLNNLKKESQIWYKVLNIASSENVDSNEENMYLHHIHLHYFSE